MSENPLHLAYDDLRRVLSRPSSLVIIAAVVAALGISGPFGTIDSLTFVPRLGYWVAIVAITLPSCWLACLTVVFALRARGFGRMALWIAGSVVAALLATAEVAVINLLVYNQSIFAAGETSALLLSTVPIAVLITAAFTWGYRDIDPDQADDSPPAPAQTGPQAPRLLARLPLDKRGALISLSVQDHYVEIVTAKGRAMLLMRLGDAITEAEGCAGLQVHRSHWVALDQVRASRRDGARGVLTLSDGREIPVSRTYLPEAKEAGLF
ncbi:LytTR family transcriptional regulator [Rhodobacter sp. NTK016B]|uniref:LytTR family DNA-binding domain-containing protein n=1 Tax=Rhodobacter sp. NTK016B TaxID=2759676 RepID=UPI001A8E26F4|nr:LytTR family transcriptional regulator [Rhodobacter sp. NTK016B]